MRFRRVVLASLFVPLLVLSACSKDPVKPAPFTPSPTVSESSPTATPTGPVEPTMPAAAEGRSRAAAKGFVKYFVDVINYAQANGEVATLRRISAASCTSCTATANSLSALYDDGKALSDGAWNVSTWGTSPPRAGADFAFEIVVKTSPQTLADPTGEPTTYTGGKTTYTIDVLSTSGGWRTTWLDTVD